MESANFATWPMPSCFLERKYVAVCRETRTNFQNTRAKNFIHSMKQISGDLTLFQSYTDLNPNERKEKTLW